MIYAGNVIMNSSNVPIFSIDFGQEACWHPDLGATNHVTNDLNNFNLATEYQWGHKLHMRNGAGISIFHVGKSILESNSHSFPWSFLLKDLLHVQTHHCPEQHLKLQ